MPRYHQLEVRCRCWYSERDPWLSGPPRQQSSPSRHCNCFEWWWAWWWFAGSSDTEVPQGGHRGRPNQRAQHHQRARCPSREGRSQRLFCLDSVVSQVWSDLCHRVRPGCKVMKILVNDLSRYLTSATQLNYVKKKNLDDIDQISIWEINRCASCSILVAHFVLIRKLNSSK